MKPGIYGKYGKRLLDIVFSLVGLILISPVFLTVMILVRVKLGSPIFFHQNRPGRNGKIFGLLKFRSMTDARGKDGELLPDEQRLPHFGRVLRSTSLDELPEFINILKGDMSFVGPRPLLVRYLPYYTEEEMHRHDVRPGLTGWAQINGRDELPIEVKARLDGEYAQNICFAMDVRCFFGTIGAVLNHKGYVEGGSSSRVEKEKEK